MYLKDMKASYTLELSEYAVKSKINEEPAFNRWVKDALQTRGWIILRMERSGVYVAATGQGGAKKKWWRTTHKFGIEVPKTVEDSLEIYSKTGTDLCDETIRKEMTNVRILFEKIDGLTQ